MNLVRMFRAELAHARENASNWVNAELDNLVARIQAGWNHQHNAQGEHTAITAQTAVVNGLARVARLSVSSPLPPVVAHPSRLTLQLPNSGSPYHNLPVPSDVGHLRLIPDALGATLTGITTAGRVPGDVLIVSNAGAALDQVFTLSLWNTGSFAVNRFDGLRNAPGSQTVTVTEGRMIWLMVDCDDFNLSLLRWRVMQT